MSTVSCCWICTTSHRPILNSLKSKPVSEILTGNHLMMMLQNFSEISCSQKFKIRNVYGQEIFPTQGFLDILHGQKLFMSLEIWLVVHEVGEETYNGIFSSGNRYSYCMNCETISCHLQWRLKVETPAFSCVKQFLNLLKKEYVMFLCLLLVCILRLTNKVVNLSVYHSPNALCAVFLTF